MENTKKILIVDDERDILNLLQYNLEKEGFKVQTVNNGKKAIELAGKFNPDLIILDVMMPEMDGIEVCQELRKNPGFFHTIIVFLTARSEDYSQIAGYEAGADDYIAKPLKPKVFINKVKALFRRLENKITEDLNNDELPVKIDRGQYAVITDEKTIQLPKKEFELLSLLLSKPGKVFTRDSIMNEVWGIDSFVGDRTIDVHIRKLREKIGVDHIKTIKGVGYKFEIKVEE